MWEVLESVATLAAVAAAMGAGWLLGYRAGLHSKLDEPPEDPDRESAPETKRSLVSISDVHRLDAIFGTTEEPPHPLDSGAPRSLTKCGGIGNWIVVYEETTSTAWVVCDIHVRPFLENKKATGRNFMFLAIKDGERRAGSCEGAPIFDPK